MNKTKFTKAELKLIYEMTNAREWSGIEEGSAMMTRCIRIKEKIEQVYK